MIIVFIIPKLIQKINCGCLLVLKSNSNEHKRYFLIQQKNRGRLVNPVSDDVKICKIEEKF